MKLRLDTHLLFWAAGAPDRLSRDFRSLIDDSEHELLFSAASLWEVAIKRGLGRHDFKVDGRLLRGGVLDNGYSRLPIVSDLVVAIELADASVRSVLVAQATVEGVTLLLFRTGRSRPIAPATSPPSPVRDQGNTMGGLALGEPAGDAVGKYSVDSLSGFRRGQ